MSDTLPRSGLGLRVASKDVCQESKSKRGYEKNSNVKGGKARTLQSAVCEDTEGMTCVTCSDTDGACSKAF